MKKKKKRARVGAKVAPVAVVVVVAAVVAVAVALSLTHRHTDTQTHMHTCTHARAVRYLDRDATGHARGVLVTTLEVDAGSARFGELLDVCTAAANDRPDKAGANNKLHGDGQSLIWVAAARTLSLGEANTNKGHGVVASRKVCWVDGLIRGACSLLVLKDKLNSDRAITVLSLVLLHSMLGGLLKLLPHSASLGAGGKASDKDRHLNTKKEKEWGKEQGGGNGEDKEEDKEKGRWETRKRGGGG